MKFPLLEKRDIECRVAQVAEYSGKVFVSVLLYKNARVDMRILDEVCGPENWQREHALINDNLFCTVSIWDKEKSQWVKKQDVGVESYTEKEKGQASDAFKRACFNVGIGRELYTAPRIRIELKDAEYDKGDGKAKVKPFVRFFVDVIEYNNDAISHLIIKDNKGNDRFEWRDLS